MTEVWLLTVTITSPVCVNFSFSYSSPSHVKLILSEERNAWLERTHKQDQSWVRYVHRAMKLGSSGARAKAIPYAGCLSCAAIYNIALHK